MLGLVSSVCFSSCNSVTCIENDSVKYDSLLQGKIPFYEPELTEKLTKNINNGRLTIKASMDSTIFDNDLIFLQLLVHQRSTLEKQI